MSWLTTAAVIVGAIVALIGAVLPALDPPPPAGAAFPAATPRAMIFDLDIHRAATLLIDR